MAVVGVVRIRADIICGRDQVFGSRSIVHLRSGWRGNGVGRINTVASVSTCERDTKMTIMATAANYGSENSDQCSMGSIYRFGESTQWEEGRNFRSNTRQTDSTPLPDASRHCVGAFSLTGGLEWHGIVVTLQMDTKAAVTPSGNLK